MKPDPRRVTFARAFIAVAVFGAAAFVLFFEISERGRSPADFQAAFMMAAVWSVLLAVRVARRSIVAGVRGAPLHPLHLLSAVVAVFGVPLVTRVMVPGSADGDAAVLVIAVATIVLAGILFRLGNAAQAKR